MIRVPGERRGATRTELPAVENTHGGHDGEPRADRDRRGARADRAPGGRGRHARHDRPRGAGLKRVVLLHSALGDSRLWKRQVAALSPQYEVVTPDLPGWGETPLPTEPFSFVDVVAGHLPGALVGNSFGGATALRTALAHQDKVDKLVLVDAGLPAWDYSEEMRDYWAAENDAIDAGDLELATQINLDFWVRPDLHDEVRPQQLRALQLQTAHEEPEVRWPEMPALSKLRIPTLVVVGERDKADFHAIAQHLAEEIPDAELVIVPGAGHLVGIEEPEELNAVLLEFLSE